jgi:DNA-binding SARP family transcriptional activator
VQFRILGPLELRHRQGQLIRLGAPKQRTLLALLLLHANQPVSSHRLIEALWPDRVPPSVASALRTHVSWLRRALGPTAQHATPAVTAEPGAYRLTVVTEQLDLLLFERLSTQGEEELAACRPEPAVELLHRAMGLWRGRALEDVELDGVAAAELAQLAERRLGVAESWVTARLAMGQHDQLLAELARLVEEEPLRERLWAQWMLALYRSGRQADALEAFRLLRGRLIDELGVEPSPPLQRLQRQILALDPALDPSAPPASRAGPAMTSRASTVPRQLPADVATFTGRGEQLRRLDGMLGEEAAARAAGLVIAAIAGTAGVGKTALAVHWAHLMAERFPDGQLYINLNGFAPGAPASPLQALAHLLRSIGVEADKVPVEVEEAAGLYRSLMAGRRMLVLLDNAVGAEQVRPLLPGRPGCMVLITSRDRLAGLVASHGVQRLTLDVLDPGEAVDLLVQALGHDRAVTEPDAIQELAQVCAYLPLALRIAVANLSWQPGQSVAGYVAGLRAGDPLADLEVAGDPQAAVRAAFDHSYRRLVADVRRLFRLVALVPGATVTAPAAAALAGIEPGQAGRLLDRLAASHLLEVPTPGRFAFHDLLRRYARDLADRQEPAREREAALHRLLTWYLRAADAADRLLYPGMVRLPVPSADGRPPALGFDDHGGALAWLRAEWDNLVAAITHAAAHGPRQLGRLLADALRGFLWTSPNAVDHLTIAHAGRAAARLDADLQAQAAAELSLGNAYQCMGGNPQAIEHYGAALDLARRAGWLEAQAAALSQLGNVHQDVGDPQQAISYQTTALDLHLRADNAKGQATALGNLGNLHWELGDLRRAADYQNQALALYRGIGSRVGEANCLDSLGEVAHALGQVDEAIAHLTRALALHREVGDSYGEAYNLGCLAAVHVTAGRRAHALDLARAALALASERGDRRVQAETHNTLGAIHLGMGLHRQAGAHHEEALALARQTGSRYAETGALLGLAAARRDAGDHRRASRHARQALTLASQAGYRTLRDRASAALEAGQQR